MPDLAEQTRVRLRRIEGQVRGLQHMLDRMEEDPSARERLESEVRNMLATGASQAEAARRLGVSKQRVSDIAHGRPGPEIDACDPCDNLLTQILAVRAAVEQVGLMIMELHLQQCVLEGVPMDDERLHSLRDSLKLWSRLSSAP
jgi:DNA-binding FrmR family transcriptional regulator